MDGTTPWADSYLGRNYVNCVVWLFQLGVVDGSLLITLAGKQLDQTMKGKRYTTEDKIPILREADRGDRSTQVISK